MHNHKTLTERLVDNVYKHRMRRRLRPLCLVLIAVLAGFLPSYVLESGVDPKTLIWFVLVPVVVPSAIGLIAGLKKKPSFQFGTGILLGIFLATMIRVVSSFWV